MRDRAKSNLPSLLLPAAGGGLREGIRGSLHNLRSGLEWIPARSHKPYDAGSNPASATSVLRCFRRHTALVRAFGKKGSGTVVRSTLWAVPATVPDPFFPNAKAADRVRLPAGPLEYGDACTKGARLPCKQTETGSIPVVSTRQWARGPMGRRRPGVPAMRVRLPPGPLLTEDVPWKSITSTGRGSSSSRLSFAEECDAFIERSEHAGLRRRSHHHRQRLPHAEGHPRQPRVMVDDAELARSWYERAQGLLVRTGSAGSVQG